MKLPKELREKKDLGRPGKEKKCSVRGCFENAMRSLSENKYGKILERAKLKIEENRQHKIFLCKPHYREAEKTRKSQEKLYQKKGFLDNASATLKGKYMDDI